MFTTPNWRKEEETTKRVARRSRNRIEPRIARLKVFAKKQETRHQ